MDPFFYSFVSRPTDDPDIYDYQLWEAYGAFAAPGTPNPASPTFQTKYEGVLRDYPWLKKDHPRNHCQGAARYFTDQILIAPEDQSLLTVNESPKNSGQNNNEDFFLNLDCEIPTLTDLITAKNRAGQGGVTDGPSLQFAAGFLYFYQVQGRTLQIPDRICQNAVQSWTPFHVATLEDFQVGLPNALAAPLRLEEQGWASCDASNPKEIFESNSEEKPLAGIGASINELIYVDPYDPIAIEEDPTRMIQLGVQHFLGKDEFQTQVQELVTLTAQLWATSSEE